MSFLILGHFICYKVASNDLSFPSDLPLNLGALDSAKNVLTRILDNVRLFLLVDSQVFGCLSIIF